ncbi:hypothetical protein LTS18_009321, partial [Coniosporium uncinatum]
MAREQSRDKTSDTVVDGGVDDLANLLHKLRSAPLRQVLTRSGASVNRASQVSLERRLDSVDTEAHYQRRRTPLFAMSTPSPKRRKLTPTEFEPTPFVDVDRIRRTPTRPSFMSPTKASLARNNPELLPRPTSSGSIDSRPGHSPSRPVSRGSVISRPASRGQPVRLAQPTDNQRPKDTGVATEASLQIDRPETPEAEVAAADMPAELSDDVAEDGRPAAIRASEDSNHVHEPSLRQKSLEDALPRGLLYTTPSKRPPGGMNLDRAIRKSPRNAVSVSEQQNTAPQINQNESPASDAQQESANVQPPPPSDEYLEKMRERETLYKEMQVLRKEVQQYERHMSVLKPDGDDRSSDKDLKLLVALLAKGNNNAKDAEESAPLSQLLASFMPFAKPAQAAPDAATSIMAVASHRPVDLDDPQPYLRLFTSFTTESTMTMSTHRANSLKYEQ